MAHRSAIRTVLGAAVVVAFAGLSAFAIAQAETMSMGDHDMTMPAAAAMTMPPPAADNRLVVDFPPAFKRQELSHMRSHLESLQLITQSLAVGNYQAASDIADRRLTRGGMSQHDRHDAARYMPKKMLAMGAAMHRAAGHFAIVAQDAAVTNDMAATLKALAEVEQRCVACHASYRMR